MNYLKTLREVHGKKSYFTKERFSYYFAMLGKKNVDIESLWRIWEKFPYFPDNELDDAGWIIQKILEYPEGVSSSNFLYVPRKNKKRVYEKTGGGVQSFEINLNEEKDIMLYADFLNRKPEIIVTVDFIEEVYCHSKTFNVFDGDVFTTADTWGKRRDGEIFMCNKGTYQRMLYTQGKGYIRNGEPDLDETEYSHHVLTLKDKFYLIGNVYADPSFLIDGEVKTDE